MTIEKLIVKHKKLVDAAARAFSKATYDAVSTTDVAREAGVSQPYIMQVFGSKQRLYSSVQEYVYATVLELLRKTPGSTGANFLRGNTISDQIPQYFLDFLQRSLQSAHYPFVAERIRKLYTDSTDLLVGERGQDPAEVATKISRALNVHFIKLIGADQLLNDHPHSGQVLSAMVHYELHPPRASRGLRPAEESTATRETLRPRSSQLHLVPNPSEANAADEAVRATEADKADEVAR